jgi:DNA uptake protein ComE-like DNA-binding protein
MHVAFVQHALRSRAHNRRNLLALLRQRVASALLLRARMKLHLAAALLLLGCQAPIASEDEAALAEHREPMSEGEENAVLEVVNTATLAALDDDAGLDSRAAENIVARRDGADGAPGTADDRLYTSLAELDAVAYVGESALAKLLAYAESLGLVTEPAGGDAALLALVNSASVTLLDLDVGLDARAAENIVAHRDGADGVAGSADDDWFDDVAELDAVAYVGEAAIAKLRSYAAEHAGEAAPCLVISEYIESSGMFNKAIEIYNCGAEPVRLSQIGVCLVTNSATSCTTTAKLADVTLPPGEVWGVCKAKSHTWMDPWPHITDHCDEEQGGVMSHDGNDRLLLFRDADGDARFDAAVDTALDAFGALSQVPGWWWEDKVYRRCDLTPFDGVHATSFYARDYFTEHARHDMEHYGTPPDPSATCP